jgi:hypothetical protein
VQRGVSGEFAVELDAVFAADDSVDCSSAGAVEVTGTASQIEWADQIRPRVAAEFERVASALRVAAEARTEADRAYTDGVLEILEEKRGEVLAREEAGYYIREWQELGDQVRRMIGQDARFQELLAARRARLAGEMGKLDAV